MQQFLRMMAIFIQYPWLAALIGVLMLALGRSRGRGAAVAAGITWLLYAVYETGMNSAGCAPESATSGSICCWSIRYCSW